MAANAEADSIANDRIMATKPVRPSVCGFGRAVISTKSVRVSVSPVSVISKAGVVVVRVTGVKVVSVSCCAGGVSGGTSSAMSAVGVDSACLIMVSRGGGTTVIICDEPPPPDGVVWVGKSWKLLLDWLA